MSNSTISSSLATPQYSVNQLTEKAAKPDSSMTTKEAFQKFVASTFYKQMLKALRSTQQTVQYMDGGQAEQAFRSQLDQQISEDLAENHGAAFSDSLYDRFQNNLDTKRAQAGSQINYLA
ncbi:rod-binding protein [uncultured Rubinisphaera sp.]|mgnify:CR=1 FL=1|uniref:rod-binding protein n=1 Tax=uncultured Rubinisphaera sp. TaxID=1678686 RepID=UPI0030D70AD6|tara:strand:+ start:105 stop:464 length:360 start_codon:yes stop_codon:yes gene_type:complete